MAVIETTGLSTGTSAAAAIVPHRATIDQTLFGGVDAYFTTGKEIQGDSPNFESYDKSIMWSGGNSNYYTFAAFLRVPSTPTDTYPTVYIASDSGINLQLYAWDDVNNLFQVFLEAPPSVDYRTHTLGLSTHGIKIGDWFAIMLSIDYSGASANFEIWTQKVGDSAAANIYAAPFTNDAGPGVFAFDSTYGGFSIASHPYYDANALDIEISEFYMSNEFVDWSDAAERAKYINDDGRPVGLGPTGALLTGTAAKIYLPGGDGTDNKGTGGNFTEVGTIVDSSTSPTDGVAPGSVSKITQSATGTVVNPPVYATIAQTLGTISQSMFADDGARAGSIAQSLSPLTSDMIAFYFKGTKFGPIEQTLSKLSQALSGTYEPGITYGVIDTTLVAITQSADGLFSPGAKTGLLAQSLSPIGQAMDATFYPGTKTASASQQLLSITQLLSGTYEPGISTSEITQNLLPISQSLYGKRTNSSEIIQTLPLITQFLAGSNTPGISTGTISQNLSSLHQSLFGETIGTGYLVQTLGVITQSVTGTSGPGASDGSVVQTLKMITQSLTGTYAPGISTGTIEQTLPAISQKLYGVAYIAEPAEPLLWEQRTEELIWEQETDELLWEQ